MTVQKNLFLGTWSFLSSDSSRSGDGSEFPVSVNPDQIQSLYGLRPILKTELVLLPQFPFFKEITYVFANTTGGGFLDTQRWS